jgi:hypothetical protein
MAHHVLLLLLRLLKRDMAHHVLLPLLRLL